MHYVPGTALSSSHNCSFHLRDNPEIVCTCILQVRRLKHRGAKERVQSHSQWQQGRASELGRLVPGPKPLPTDPFYKGNSLASASYSANWERSD